MVWVIHSLNFLYFYPGLQQVEFTCDITGNMVWSGPNGNFSAPNGADLTTSLRTDCVLCQRLPDTSPFISRFDNLTHCVGKLYLLMVSYSICVHVVYVSMSEP